MGLTQQRFGQFQRECPFAYSFRAHEQIAGSKSPARQGITKLLYDCVMSENALPHGELL